MFAALNTLRYQVMKKYDLKTFEVKARPVTKVEGLRPGMSLVLKK